MDRDDMFSDELQFPGHDHTKTEHQRRFLVADASIADGYSYFRIIQGYLFSEDGFTVRVRRLQERAASGRHKDSVSSVTVKGPRVGRDRERYSTVVSHLIALQLIRRAAHTLRKRRYQLRDYANVLWDIDVFIDANDGLVIAEVAGDESAISSIPRPAWTLRELIDEPQFNNEELARRPINRWTPDERRSLT